MFGGQTTKPSSVAKNGRPQLPLLPENHSMFVVDLHYVAPLDQVDSAIPGHVEFLTKNYASGVFIASGRKVPRTGGVIIAVAESKEKLEAVLGEDPFQHLGLARYTVTEFIPSMLAPQLAT